ncbi:hypothetical protein CEXT_352331 [Caerostris extrusa]|uniref:Uncharacterized protein n=1 Tax=Caerostris extrusa TaxID=172846 RepID=A0AAV4V508_CAEEX|nr:hypothetical protein CEXT_352331 [Caerostris extrusa]
MISSPFIQHERILCLQKPILAVLTEMTIITFILHKNDSHLMRPNHAVAILSNKKNTRLVLLNTPCRTRKQPKDLASFKISPPDGAEYLLLQNSQHLPKDTLQRVVCNCSNKGECLWEHTLKLFANDFHYGGRSGVCSLKSDNMKDDRKFEFSLIEKGFFDK